MVLTTACLPMHGPNALGAQEAVSGLIESEATALNGKHVRATEAYHGVGVEGCVGAPGQAVRDLLAESLLLPLVRHLGPHPVVHYARCRQRRGAGCLAGGRGPLHREGVLDPAADHGRHQPEAHVLAHAEPAAHLHSSKLALCSAVAYSERLPVKLLPRPAATVEAVIANLHEHPRRWVDALRLLVGDAEEVVVERGQRVHLQHPKVLGVALPRHRVFCVGVVVEVVVPARLGDPHGAVAGHGEKAPVVLWLPARGRVAAAQGHAVHRLRRVAIRRPIRYPVNVLVVSVGHIC
mmetsp:Transcript_15212/g.43512  ORF Transcript_15212/g.43512 Transcript_15212/m.43512 type:complete len:293 (-) Transcript_15212:1071-1949(-)